MLNNLIIWFKSLVSRSVVLPMHRKIPRYVFVGTSK